MISLTVSVEDFSNMAALPRRRWLMRLWGVVPSTDLVLLYKADLLTAILSHSRSEVSDSLSDKAQFVPIPVAIKLARPQKPVFSLFCCKTVFRYDFF